MFRIRIIINPTNPSSNSCFFTVYFYIYHWALYPFIYIYIHIYPDVSHQASSGFHHEDLWCLGELSRLPRLYRSASTATWSTWRSPPSVTSARKWGTRTGASRLRDVFVGAGWKVKNGMCWMVLLAFSERVLESRVINRYDQIWSCCVDVLGKAWFYNWTWFYWNVQPSGDWIMMSSRGWPI